MGSFANSMFSSLLGWFRTAAMWVWNVLFNAEDGGLVGWIGENWLGLIIALCVICLAVDFVVHMLRWRPYRVWASFLRRLQGKERLGDTGQYSGRMRREWHYADGTAKTEEVEAPVDAAAYRRVSSREMPRQYVQVFARPERLKYQEELRKDRPVTGLEDYPQPRKPVQQDETPSNRTEGLRKRMMRFREESENGEMNFRFRPAPPAVNKNDAYHQPYYPPQWKKPSEATADSEEETYDEPD